MKVRLSGAPCSAFLGDAWVMNLGPPYCCPPAQVHRDACAGGGGGGGRRSGGAARGGVQAAATSCRQLQVLELPSGMDLACVPSQSPSSSGACPSQRCSHPGPAH